MLPFHELTEFPPGFGVRHASATLKTIRKSKAALACHTSRRCRDPARTIRICSIFFIIACRRHAIRELAGKCGSFGYLSRILTFAQSLLPVLYVKELLLVKHRFDGL